RALGLPEGRPILLSIGNLTENKGFHLIIQAVARLRHRRPDILFVIVGDGEYRSALEAKVRELGLANAVRFVGSRPHESLSEWYSAANVFCLASRSEGWPNVVLEAMACGLPVIATRAWGGAIVISSSLGILVEREPQALQDAIDDALAKSWDRDSIV